MELPPHAPVPDYIDELDLEMLRRKQKLDMQNYKQPTPKWLNIAWDAFRIVDNHSKSMIFQMPDDPRNEDYREYQRVVDKPLSLEAIRVCIFSHDYWLRLSCKASTIRLLKSSLLTWKHSSITSLSSEDKVTLFFRIFTYLDHKLYKFCEGVQKRFEKFVEKGRLRANMDS